MRDDEGPQLFRENALWFMCCDICYIWALLPSLWLTRRHWMPALKTVRDGDGGKGSPKILILKFFEHYSKGRRGAGGGQPHVKKKPQNTQWPHECPRKGLKLSTECSKRRGGFTGFLNNVKKRPKWYFVASKSGKAYSVTNKYAC